MRLARFNMVRDLFVIERHSRTAAGRALADEADRSVDGNPVKPGVCMGVLFQARQCPPDLKQDFLIQVVPIGGVPRINRQTLRSLGRFSLIRSKNCCSSGGFNVRSL
jgi:hypothetical protein